MIKNTALLEEVHASGFVFSCPEYVTPPYSDKDIVDKVIYELGAIKAGPVFCRFPEKEYDAKKQLFLEWAHSIHNLPVAILIKEGI